MTRIQYGALYSHPLSHFLSIFSCKYIIVRLPGVIHFLGNPDSVPEIRRGFYSRIMTNEQKGAVRTVHSLLLTI